MITYYTIRRVSDNRIICAGYCAAPFAEITAPEGCEVLPYRVTGDVAVVKSDGEQLTVEQFAMEEETKRQADLTR